MSQHLLQAHEPGRYSVVVGYDRPLDNFFGQVHDLLDPNADEPVKWVVGTLDLVELRAEIAPYADLSPEMAHILQAERRTRDDHPSDLVVDHRKTIALDEDRQLNTVLAALRFYDASGKSTNLSSDAIDQLCEDINTRGYLNRVLGVDVTHLDVAVPAALHSDRKSTIIAALAGFREAFEDANVPLEIHEIATDGFSSPPLSVSQMDRLSEKIARDWIPADPIFDLPVFARAPNDIVVNREAMTYGPTITMSIVGRSEIGDRVIGKIAAGSFVSVDRADFESMRDDGPRFNDTVSVQRVDGREKVVRDSASQSLGR